MLRKVGIIIGGSTCVGFSAAWWYRPLPDRNEAEGSGPKRSSELCSRINMSDRVDVGKDVPIPLRLSRFLSVSITTVAVQFFMRTYGRVQIEQDKCYNEFLKQVLKREEDKGLLTVSNHRSLFDDPGVISCLLPFWHGMRPKYQRWGICSQEYCFNDALPGIIKGYIGAGQVLPIWRGGGIDQKLLLDFARHLGAGQWCHIFPEAGVWQNNELGGRRCDDNSLSPKGKFKWGAAKLIAHAPRRPVVIPFVHRGIEVLLPQDPITRKTRMKSKIIGGDELNVQIKFGDPIDFTDLIEAHEREHGTLWTYKSHMDSEEKMDSDGWRKNWQSSNAEKQLYHKITLRIERHVEQLYKSL